MYDVIALLRFTASCSVHAEVRVGIGGGPHSLWACTNRSTCRSTYRPGYVRAVNVISRFMAKTYILFYACYRPVVIEVGAHSLWACSSSMIMD